MNIGRVLGQSFSLLITGFVPFCLLASLVSVPTILHAVLGPESDDFDRTQEHLGYLGELLRPLVLGAIAFGVFERLRGRPAGLVAMADRARSRAATLMLVSIATGVLVFLGLLILVVPGLVFWCMYFVAGPAAAVERLPMLATLNRSSALTSGRRMHVLAVLLVSQCLWIGLEFGYWFGIWEFWPDVFHEWTSYRVALVVGEVLQVPASAYAAVVVATTYDELRIASEGLDASIRDVFD